MLSFKTASDLGLIKINISTIGSRDAITIDAISKQHPELFNGVGKLIDFQVRLHIDKNIKPSAQNYQRVPFHLCKKVEEELKLLLEQDIIEHAEGPTPWMSPIVTSLKPKDPTKVRICVDMRRANEAIQRQRHVTPTLDDNLHALNRATAFSKLDLNSAYHQLEIHPDSRYIAMFSTHIGLYNYKRLNFGISSASEAFQHTIAQVLSDMPGVKNVSDDILV